MATINVYTRVIATVNGVDYKFGDQVTPATITAAGNDVYEVMQTVATETTVTLFTSGTDLDDFDFGIIAVDQDCTLELVTDSGDAVGIEQYTIGLKGSGTTGTWGVPFILATDDSYANYTINFGGGTLDNIDIIRVRNLSSTTTAQVRALLFT